MHLKVESKINTLLPVMTMFCPLKLVKPGAYACQGFRLLWGTPPAWKTGFRFAWKPCKTSKSSKSPHAVSRSEERRVGREKSTRRERRERRNEGELDV